MRSAARAPADAAARHAVAVVVARGAVRDGDGAQAAFFLVDETAAFEVERVGVGAEGEEGEDEG